MDKNELSILSLGLVKRNQEALRDFTDRILKILDQWNNKADIVVLPEYSWGNLKTEDVEGCIKQIINNNYSYRMLILGTFVRNNEGTTTNSAIIVYDDKIKYIDKINLLDTEREKGIVPGKNTGSIVINGFNIGVLICADLWDVRLVERVVIDEKAELLIIPSFTAVPPGHGGYSKQLWYSLGITRSREFVVPIVIADHHHGNADYDVGNATCIIDPSRKSKNMNKQEDFLITSPTSTVFGTLEFTKINNYREYRKNRGLLKKNRQ